MAIAKVLLVWCCAAVLLAVAFAAEAEPSTVSKVLNAPRRILRGYAHAWSGGRGGVYGPGTYSDWGYGRWGGMMGMGMMWPYQENRWVSASRMDTSVERRFNMASK